jgi:hypothetical protein
VLHTRGMRPRTPTLVVAALVLTSLGLLGLELLLFPDGRLPSRRWQPVAWLALLAPLLVVVGQGFAPGPLDTVPSVTNPLGIPGAAWLAAVAAFGENVLGAVARGGAPGRTARGVTPGR